MFQQMLSTICVLWFVMAQPCQAADQTAVAAATAHSRPAAFAECLDCKQFLEFDTSFLPPIQKRIPFIDGYPVKQESCANLFRDMSRNTEPIAWPPPRLKQIKTDNTTFYDDMLMGGLATEVNWYVAEKYNGNVVALHWTPNKFNKYIHAPSTCGNYYTDTCERIMMSYSSAYVFGKVGMVIGSEIPWAEALGKRYDIFFCLYMRITRCCCVLT